MPRERARYLLVALASLAIGYALGSLRDDEVIIISDEPIGTADYTKWATEYDHDWRSGF